MTIKSPTRITVFATSNLPTRDLGIGSLIPISYSCDPYPMPAFLPKTGALLVAAFLISTAASSAQDQLRYNDHIRPILSENCFHCHGPDANKRKADLRLDNEEGAAGILSFEGDDVTQAELVARILSDDPDEVMPPPDSNRSLTEPQKQQLRQWVAEGGKYQQHWAFEKPVRPEPPTELSQPQWGKNPIDAFVLSRLDKQKIQPSPGAPAHTLIRRVSFDLIGLPPTPEEVSAFEKAYAANSDAAYEALVDRLLASPHYGERMALPWLDAGRYADSNGFQGDGDRHHWLWRDWVVNAMNDNMPFDQFTIEQLAGDLLPEPSQDQLIATAFNRNHILNGEGGAIAEEQRNNYVFDRVDTTATNWLALTLACAQCHDHKFDPLSQKEYYQFFAYFNTIDETGKVDRRNGRVQYADPILKIASPEQEAREKALGKDLYANRKIIKDDQEQLDQLLIDWWATNPKAESLPENQRPNLGRDFVAIVPANQSLLQAHYLKKVSDNAAWKEAQLNIDRIESETAKLANAIPVIMIMGEQKPEEQRETHVLDRGDYESPLEKVVPEVPAVLHTPPAEAPRNRLTLANWLIDENNPLTARVIVNRYWQHFFGIGIVKTAEDFGVQSEPPSHPLLLDWLAREFIESGWDVKHMHRLILTSATYRQSSVGKPELIRDDPENRMLARGARYRLPAMMLRDQALAVSGLLDGRIGGRPVYPYQPEGMWLEFSYDKFSYTPSSGDDLYRRSLYTFWRRTVAPPNMFDAANRQTCTVRGGGTNTPLHALTTLNDPTFVEASRIWAERIIREGGNDPTSRLRWAFHQATAHQPSDTELTLLTGAQTKAHEHFKNHPEAAAELLSIGEKPADKKLDPIEVASYTHVAQLILNLDEVLVKE